MPQPQESRKVVAKNIKNNLHFYHTMGYGSMSRNDIDAALHHDSETCLVDTFNHSGRKGRKT